MSADHQLMNFLGRSQFAVTFSAIPRLTYPSGFVSGCHKSQRIFNRGILYSGEAKTWPLAERFEFEADILAVDKLYCCCCILAMPFLSLLDLSNEALLYIINWDA